MALENEITLVFDERVKGFPTFQTYVASTGLSIDNRHFTFSGGGVYEHNSSVPARGTFYGNKTESTVEVVFNDSPSAVKDFWSVGYEGTDNWSAELSSDLDSEILDDTTVPYTRSISCILDIADFIKREGKYFSGIKGVYTDFEMPDLSKIYVNSIGAGNYESPVADGESGTIVFDNVPEGLQAGITQDNVAYEGDRVFYYQSIDPLPGGELQWDTDNLRYAGKVDTYDSDRTITISIPIQPRNRVEHNNRVYENISQVIQKATFQTNFLEAAIWEEQPLTDLDGNAIEYNIPVVQPINDGDFFIYAKNGEVETSSLKGFFCTMTFKNNSNDMAELFSINAEVSPSSN